MLSFAPLLAQTTTETTLEFTRIQERTDWVLPVVVCAAVFLFVRYMYRRDSRELSPLLGWLLTGLRVLAFLALLVLYLDPQWRTERTVTRNSRVFLLVDTSNSMSFGADSPVLTPGEDTRSERVAKALKNSDFLQRLRQKHDVFVLGFDKDIRRLHMFPKLSRQPQPGGEGGAAVAAELPEGGGAVEGEEGPTSTAEIDWLKLLSPVGKESRIGDAIRALVEEEQSPPPAGIILFSDFVVNQGGDPGAAAELAGEARVPIYPVGLGSERRPANVRVSELLVHPRVFTHREFVVTGLLQAFGLGGTSVDVELLARPAGAGEGAGKAGTGTVIATGKAQFTKDGEPVKVEFKLTPKEVFELDEEGTGKQTLCLRVKRTDAVPEDNFDEEDIEVVKEQTRVLLLASGPTREYRFLRTMLHGGVINEGGESEQRPMIVDILLQTAQEGISQEADKILDHFPETLAELDEYHCIVAFDPKWEDEQRGLTGYQAEMLRQWVDEGGGLIVIAGPVCTRSSVAAAIHDRNIDKVRDVMQTLYPVEFEDEFSIRDLDRVDASKPRRLLFTREGQEADFLWLTNDPKSSEEIWAEFCGGDEEPGGVYAYYPVEGPKKGATVYARVEAPEVGSKEEEQPVYFVGHTYGSGRVFYLGSGEMWRLRRVDPDHFGVFYTKLIGHVSQGRLTRGSKRGALLVDVTRRVVGENVDVRARLKDEQLQPYVAKEVLMQVIYQDGTAESVTLEGDPATPGSFVGQFRASREGKYRLELPIPYSDAERLVKTIRVALPKGEQQDPCLNRELLEEIARKSQSPRLDAEASAGQDQGDEAAVEMSNRREPQWYIGVDSAIQSDGADDLVAHLTESELKLRLPQSPSEAWEKRWLLWMMCIVCGVLCVEWLIRRLARLA